MNAGNSSENRTRPFASLLLLLVVTAITLAIADAIFRLYERSQLVPRLPDVNDIGPVNLEALKYNDGRVDRQAAEDEFRILSFGDSYTFSVVQPQWSYSGVLQQQLQTAMPGQRFRVINLGEPATGTRQFRLAHDYWSQVFEHDAVLFHIFLGNDILDDAYLHASIDWAPNSAVFNSDNPILQAGNRRIPRKFPLRMLDYAYAWWASARSQSEGGLPEGYNWAALTSFDEDIFQQINYKFLETFDPQKLDELLAGYEQVVHLLRRAQDIAASGRKVAIALGPAEPQVDDALRRDAIEANGRNPLEFDMGLPQRIITALRDRVAPQVPLIDLSGAFRAQRQQTGEKLYFRRNTHWDRGGNRLAGEVIAAALQAHWFGAAAPPLTGNSQDQPAFSFDQAQLDAYADRLTGMGGVNAPVITGAVRAIQLIDGVSDRPDNWAIAPLGQPINVTFDTPRVLESIGLHLFQGGGRSYRLTVEVLVNGEWQMLADHSKEAVRGMLSIPAGAVPVSAIRITGLYSSAEETDPGNAYIHIQELEFRPASAP
jgi:hypothetical protein